MFEGDSTAISVVFGVLLYSYSPKRTRLFRCVRFLAASDSSHQHPPHPHAPRSRIHTDPGFFLQRNLFPWASRFCETYWLLCIWTYRRFFCKRALSFAHVCELCFVRTANVLSASNNSRIARVIIGALCPHIRLFNRQANYCKDSRMQVGL